MALPLAQPTTSLYEADGVAVPGLTGNTGAAPLTAPAPAVAPTGRTVNVITPDGKLFGLDEAYLPEAKARGYRPETPQEAGVREYLAKHKGIGGDIQVALGKIANVPFGGAPEAIEGKTGINVTRGLGALAMYGLGPAGMLAGYALGRKDPYDAAKEHALEDAHTTGNILGSGIGMLSGAMLLGGAAGKAGGYVEKKILEAGAAKALAADATAAGLGASEAAKVAPSVARSILAHSAKMATEGAVFATPQVVTEASLGDPEHAAETLVFSMAAGGALGAAIKGGGALIGKFRAPAAGGFVDHGGELVDKGPASLMAKPGDAAMSGTYLETLARDQAWRGLANNQASLKAGEKVASTIPGKTRAVGEYLNANGLRRGTLPLPESWEAYAPRLNAAYEAAGSKVSGIVGEMDRVPGSRGVNVRRIADDIESQVIKPLDKYGAILPENQAMATELKGRVAGLLEQADEHGRIPFAQAQDIRSELGKVVRSWDPNKSSTAKDKLRQVVGLMRVEIERAAEEQGSPELVAQLKDANLAYRKLKAATTVVDDYAGKRLNSNRTLSITDNMAGGAGGIMGAVAGGPLGLLSGIGGAIGHHFVRTEGNNIVAGIADALSGGAANRSGIVAGERARALVGTHMDQIPAWLTKLGTRDQLDPLPAAVFSRFLGDGAEKKADKHAAFTSLAERLTDLSANPERLHEAVSEMVGPMAHDAPNVAAATAAKLGGAVGYLQHAMPKDPNPPGLFGGGQTNWKPSDKQLSDFAKRVAVVENPFSLFQKASLTPVELDTLKAVYPSMYGEMVKRIALAGSDPKLRPTYQQRIKISALLGTPLDPSMKNIGAYQDAHAHPYASIEPGKQGGGGGQMKLPSAATDTQSALMKG